MQTTSAPNSTEEPSLSEPAEPRIDASPADSLEELPKKLAELWEYLRIYLRARWNRNKLSLRTAATGFGIGLLLLLLVTGALLTAVVFILYGTALGLGQWLERPWAGYWITGGGLLLLVTLVARWTLASWRKKSFKNKIKEYEQTIRNENEKFGSNIMERAAAANRD